MADNQTTADQTDVTTGAATGAAPAAYATGAVTIPGAPMLQGGRPATLQQQQNMQVLLQELQSFWAKQLSEVSQITDFKNHLLPLARIKKIMKSDEDVRMISAEAPVLFAKACEMFILELTLRAWSQTEEAKRRTLQRSDISAAIQRTDIFDFLIDIVPRDDPKKEEVRPVGAGVDPTQVQYYGVPGMAPAYAMPAQIAGTAGSSDGSSAMVYHQNPQQVYSTAQYGAMAYQQGAINPQYLRMQQQMYVPQYGGQYIPGQEQQPPQQ